jgi:UDP-glucose 4-epimerase
MNSIQLINSCLESDFMDIIKGKRILITGGTGSFGNAFIDFSKDCDIKFVVFSRDEKKQHDMFAL